MLGCVWRGVVICGLGYGMWVAGSPPSLLRIPVLSSTGKEGKLPESVPFDLFEEAVDVGERSREMAKEVKRMVTMGSRGRVIVGISDLTEYHATEEGISEMATARDIVSSRFGGGRFTKMRDIAEKALSLTRLQQAEIVREGRVLPNTGMVILDFDDAADEGRVMAALESIWQRSKNVWFLEADSAVDVRVDHDKEDSNQSASMRSLQESSVESIAGEASTRGVLTGNNNRHGFAPLGGNADDGLSDEIEDDSSSRRRRDGSRFLAPNGAQERSAGNPNDTYFNRQWALKHADSDRADIRALEAWEVLATGCNGAPCEGREVVVAVIDTGVDLSHPDIRDRLWVNPGEIPNNGIDDDNNGYVDDVHGWDFTEEKPISTDSSGHGTHVAGILAATTDNQYGIAGVSLSNTKLMPLAFRNLASDVIEAVDYSISMGASISSNSWGFNQAITSLRVVLEQARAKDQLVVCAVDNKGRDNTSFLDYPPNWGIDERTGEGLDNLLRVANSNDARALASSSNLGRYNVDIAAPGTEILSLTPLSTGSTLAYKTGTSMATPHVAAIAATIRGLRPEMTAGEVRRLIMDTATPSQYLENRVISGGIANFEAVARVLTGIDPEPEPTTTNQNGLLASSYGDRRPFANVFGSSTRWPYFRDEDGQTRSVQPS